jgi:lysophospholipase L1-like esterase
VLYAGDNDIGRGASAAEVIAMFGEFVETVEAHCPDAACWFVSIKPSPAREEFTDTIRAANAGIRAAIQRRPAWRYVDWFGDLLGPDGQADERLFEPDMLHVNDHAYVALADLLRAELADDG